MGMAAGAGMGAVGAYGQANAQKGALNAQAAMDANNAQIATWQASQAIISGQAQEETSDLHTGAMMGEQRAQLAANGVDLGTGSATDILTTTKFMGARDAMTIKDNASRAAWGSNMQALNYTNQANIAGTAADNINPLMAAGTSLIGGAAKVGGAWSTWQKSGGQMPTWAQ